ncbi:MAG: citrulline utilization hydrolase CtlX, partial [Candidatus Roizmanbacteria bacterium]
AQLTNTVAMVRPSYFSFNPQTPDNYFQTKPSTSESEVRDAAMAEFDRMVSQLTDLHLNVVVLESPLGPNGEITPDAVFPNNWFSTHPGKLVLYPMKAPNRRMERQPDALKAALASVNVVYPETVDLTADEHEGGVLEGTGSMVLDRTNKIAYALQSQRTTEDELNKWAKIMGYRPHFFHALDLGSKPVYHTNVVMSVGQDFAVVCTQAIASADEKKVLVASLKDSGKEVVDITIDQMYEMCGNVLQVLNTRGESHIVMSDRAQKGFTSDNIKVLEKNGIIVPVKIDTIETVGGGSARCMLAEIFS